ncbi:MAG: hypothetical protein LBH48_06590 [Bifidobacteriaceae bacterium]|jgi:hypothetical protein|nr:hypothetical protein [Bifidobacteriaceae bacterium]
MVDDRQPLPPAADTEVLEAIPSEPVPDYQVDDAVPPPAQAPEPPVEVADVQATRKSTREAAKSKRKVWFISGGVGLLAIVLAVVVFFVARGRSAPEEPVEVEPVVVTETAPPPTPTVSPVDLPAETAFAQALPSTLAEFALVEAQFHPDWLSQGATEAYALVYSDGSVTVNVIAGQWPSAGAAAEADTGTAAGAGTSSTQWVNETAVFQATSQSPEAAEKIAALFPM